MLWLDSWLLGRCGITKVRFGRPQPTMTALQKRSDENGNFVDLAEKHKILGLWSPIVG